MKDKVGISFWQVVIEGFVMRVWPLVVVEAVMVMIWYGIGMFVQWQYLAAVGLLGVLWIVTYWRYVKRMLLLDWYLSGDLRGELGLGDYTTPESWPHSRRYMDWVIGWGLFILLAVFVRYEIFG